MKQFLLSRFRKAPVQFCLACLTIGCHLFFFAYVLIAKKEPAKKVREHRVIVKTKSPSPSVHKVADKKPTPSPAPAPPLQPAKPPKPAPMPIPPRPVVPAPAIPKPAPPKPPPLPQRKAPPTPQRKQAPATIVKKTTPSKKQSDLAIPVELVHQLQESIAKIEKKPDKYRGEPQFVLPEKPAPVTTIDSMPTSMENRRDYLADVKEEVMQQLHLALHLPDFGEVKVQLELDEIGHVRTIKVLKAASQKNRQYLEKELPCMSFSCIALHKLSAKERTFIISFHNEL